ncbi:hypothetical protein AVEN_210924-1 [Araneus ventricosus]|uniref:Uncharacterized protein n=1 Tax=Araneus ventricosus TaxID=182803 RepID=A0A4Y2PU05_ARAVE|nr:hypothetical protein AVEN_210924-1 [Araneus ventricosus]
MASSSRSRRHEPNRTDLPSMFIEELNVYPCNGHLQGYYLMENTSSGVGTEAEFCNFINGRGLQTDEAFRASTPATSTPKSTSNFLQKQAYVPAECHPCISVSEIIFAASENFGVRCICEPL